MTALLAEPPARAAADPEAAKARRYHVLAPWEVDELRRARLAGAGVKQLAARFNVCPPTVSRHCRGLPKGPLGVGRAKLPALLRAWRAGASADALAERYGVSEMTVLRWCRGVPGGRAARKGRGRRE